MGIELVLALKSDGNLVFLSMLDGVVNTDDDVANIKKVRWALTRRDRQGSTTCRG
jgi:hypothetical protein